MIIFIYVDTYFHTGTEKLFEVFAESPLEWFQRNTVPPASTNEAALAAIEATSLREAEIYFPGYYKIFYVLRVLGLRELLEWNFQRMHNAFKPQPK